MCIIISIANIYTALSNVLILKKRKIHGLFFYYLFFLIPTSTHWEVSCFPYGHSSPFLREWPQATLCIPSGPSPYMLYVQFSVISHIDRFVRNLTHGLFHRTTDFEDRPTPCVDFSDDVLHLLGCTLTQGMSYLYPSYTCPDSMHLHISSVFRSIWTDLDPPNNCICCRGNKRTVIHLIVKATSK